MRTADSRRLYRPKSVKFGLCQLWLHVLSLPCATKYTPLQGCACTIEKQNGPDLFPETGAILILKDVAKNADLVLAAGRDAASDRSSALDGSGTVGMKQRLGNPEVRFHQANRWPKSSFPNLKMLAGLGVPQGTPRPSSSISPVQSTSKHARILLHFAVSAPIIPPISRRIIRFFARESLSYCNFAHRGVKYRQSANSLPQRERRSRHGF